MEKSIIKCKDWVKFYKNFFIKGSVMGFRQFVGESFFVVVDKLLTGLV